MKRLWPILVLLALSACAAPERPAPEECVEPDPPIDGGLGGTGNTPPGGCGDATASGDIPGPA